MKTLIFPKNTRQKSLGGHISRFTFHVSRFTHHASRFTPKTNHKSYIINHKSSSPAFTLLELLVVIAIIGIVAALAGPVLKHFRPNITASATRQLLDDLARARQLAISQHTIVYVIFAPTNLWVDAAYTTNSWSPKENIQAKNVLEKQMIGYAFVSTRSLADQPGQPTKRYLSSWKALPEGTFIAPFKFARMLQLTVPNFNIYTNPTAMPALSIEAFPTTINVPFPLAETRAFQNRRYVKLPYVAFDYMGRLYQEGTNNVPQATIPLVKGNIGFSRDATKRPTENPPSINESPPGNWTNSYNVVVIDGITGRARLEHL